MGAATGVGSKQFEQLADVSPKEASKHLHKLPDFFGAPVDTRRAAIRGVVSISQKEPFVLRRHRKHIVGRIDDIDQQVRLNALAAVGNLVQYFPHDFSELSEILFTVLQERDNAEKILAINTLAELSRQRPDLITPRQHLLQHLRDVSLRKKLAKGEDGTLSINYEIVEDGIEALKGGDLASRPVEQDLSPVGKHVQLSLPSRVALLSAFAPVTLLSFFFLFLLQLVEQANDEKKKTPVFRWGYFSSIHRLRLRLRNSYILVPCQVFSSLPGTASEPYSPDNDLLRPGNWDELVQVAWERDKQRCRNCLTDVGGQNGKAAFADLHTPIKEGGEYHLSNIRILCRECQEIRTKEYIAGESQ